MTDRINHDAVGREIVSFLGIVTDARACTIAGHVSSAYRVGLPQAYRLTVAALHRLRARGMVMRSGPRSESYYSLAEQKAVANG